MLNIISNVIILGKKKNELDRNTCRVEQSCIFGVVFIQNDIQIEISKFLIHICYFYSLQMHSYRNVSVTMTRNQVSQFLLIVSFNQYILTLSLFGFSKQLIDSTTDGLSCC